MITFLPVAPDIVREVMMFVPAAAEADWKDCSVAPLNGGCSLHDHFRVLRVVAVKHVLSQACDREGWQSFFIVLASICRMRSRVTPYT